MIGMIRKHYIQVVLHDVLKWYKERQHCSDWGCEYRFTVQRQLMKYILMVFQWPESLVESLTRIDSASSKGS